VHSPDFRVIAAVVTICLTAGLAACDTGDGKQLRPVDPDTTSTSTTTVAGDAVGSFDTGPLPSIPLENTGFGSLAVPDDSPGDGFELFTPWVDGDPLDERYSCDGDDVSPPLSWASPPDGTVELAFAMIDESALVDGNPFTHWVLAGGAPAEISLLEGDVPAGAIQGTNSLGTVGWSGPCPPEGDPAHIYRFTMYALNQQVELADGTAANELLDGIEAVAITSTDVTATYQR
jgi:Raf kinase inhibitor-like YbhB/YbcL family protein